MSATDAFSCVSERILKVTLVLLKKTVVAFNKCIPLIVTVSLALPKDELNFVIKG